MAGVGSEFSTDTPLGFGVGTTFETKAGLFSLTYALEQQFDNPVQLRAARCISGSSVCSEGGAVRVGWSVAARYGQRFPAVPHADFPFRQLPAECLEKPGEVK